MLNKKYIFIAIAILLLIGGGLWFYFQKPALEIKNFDDCVKAGYPALESYPAQCKTPKGETFTQDIGNELEKRDLIWLTTPRPNGEVASPLAIQGMARGFWFFEASFPIKIYDANAKELGVAVAQAQGEWMTTEFVPFSAALSFSAPDTEKGALVLEKDNPSGLPENADELRIPIIFKKVGAGGNEMPLRAYYNNSKLDPEFSCNKVFPVERIVPKTQAVARAALEELFKGTSEREKLQGFFTSINSGVAIQQLTIENGTAKVDFDEQLEFQAGGSCKVAAIRAQISETLKQFPMVKNVIISINGRTEDILQP